MKKRNIVIVGGDKRQKYMMEFLQSKGYGVYSYGLFDWDEEGDRLKGLLNGDCAVILPVPVTKNGKTVNMPFSKREITMEKLFNHLTSQNLVIGGIIGDETAEKLKIKGIPQYDFYDEDFVEKNAVLTGYGLIKILLEHIDFALPTGSYAVTGYGKVAKETARLLNSLSCDVTIVARNPKSLEEARLRGMKTVLLKDFSKTAGNFDVIINTVPHKIIDENILRELSSETKIFELASAPYGIDFESAKKYGISVIKGAGLPGKYTPKTAGELIGNKVDDFLQKEDSI